MKLPDCQVKWMADVDSTRRKFVESNFPGVSTTARMKNLLDDSSVDAIVIATPAGTHHELAKTVLQSGRHVLVEKPLATSVHEAEELVSLSDSTALILMVGHTFLHNGSIKYTRSLIESGEIGEPYYISTQRLNLGQVRNDVNVWWNLAPHDVSILLYLMGDTLPESISATGAVFIQDGIEDLVFASLKWASGTTGHIHVSWLDPGRVRTVHVVGSKKMIICDDIAEDKVQILDRGIDRIPLAGEVMDFDTPATYGIRYRTGDVHMPRLELEEPLLTEAEHFLQSIRGKRPPLTGPRNGLDVVRVLAAGAQSMKSDGTRVTIAI